MIKLLIVGFVILAMANIFFATASIWATIIAVLYGLLSVIGLFVVLRRVKAAMQGVIDADSLNSAMEREREAHELTQIILDSAPFVVCLWDDNYNIISTSKHAVEMFGVKDPDEITRGVFEYSAKLQPCGTPSPESARMQLEDAYRTGYARNEWLHVTAEGELLPAEVVIKHFKQRGKDMLVSYTKDMREIKRLQVAEEESHAKSRFLARMSHEIRTPMNAILGIVEIQLQKKGHSPETEEAFLRIHSSSKLLLAIINDILDLSMVEAGKMDIIPVQYQTERLIMDIVQLSLMLVGSKEIEFKLFVSEDLPSALIGDDLRIKQILTNLLSNAFKYTSKGCVRLSFDVEKSPDLDDIVLMVSISDTGQGMTDEQLDTLFMEFTRYNVHVNRVIEGSGLGMPIANSLIKMMGGDIDVKSIVEEGSIFTVRIPQKPGEATPLGSATAERLQNYETTNGMLKTYENIDITPMPHGKVLVVDDVEVNLYVAEGILQQYEITVDTAGSGKEAIAKIENGEVYDIIFMDHMMPGMDGIEAARIIQGMGYSHPIVALTANAVKGASDLFELNNFSGFVSKPIDVVQLNAYLMRYIGEK